MTNPTELDRAAGALVGLAAGDALGAGYEFGAPPSGPVTMIGGGLGPWEPGEWTDDTQLALCVAEVAAQGTLDPVAIARLFLDWCAAGPKDVGIQTGSVLAGAESPDAVAGRARSYFERNPNASAGNGSLMRTAPVALAHLGNDDAIADAAHTVSALTHADPLAGDACVLWCIGIDRAVREARLDGVRDGLRLLDTDARAPWANWLDEAETRPPATFTPNGYVVTALQAAWAAVSQTPIPNEQPCRHLPAALEAAVRIGHDTDTVAAIAGALLGARWGASAVPLGWRALLHGWPGYRTRDLVRLAVLATTGGVPDDAGWPAEDDLVPYYRREFALSPLAVPLADDPGLIVGNVAALNMIDCDVVVSLCRMGAQSHGREHHDVWIIDHDDPAQNPNLQFILADTAASLAAWRDEGRRVFVHCVQAQSRTPTVATVYLMRRLGLPASDALARVRHALPDAYPNRTFLAALDAIR